MRTWFLTRQYFHLLFYLFIFKVSFCGKKSSQSNKERWEHVEWKFSFSPPPPPLPKVHGTGEEGEGSPRVLTSLQGQQEPRKAGDVLPGAQGSDLNTHMSPRTPPSQSPRLLRPAPGRVLGFHIWRMGEGRSSCNEPRAKETTCLAVDLCFSSFLNRLKKHNSAPSLPRSFQVIFFAEGGKGPAGPGQVTGGLEPPGHRRPRALRSPEASSPRGQRPSARGFHPPAAARASPRCPGDGRGFVLKARPVPP
ncbi:uncharacterized protein LOC133236841 [Bos javanicus]|uniref:uncharacterized protein LOC133236841 n=1 Tax=Bos javanicus TaxID=9906 RepID=UPI002AA940FF|nr:uncharacterized protein LOC133236841 [Bos javanicus]